MFRLWDGIVSVLNRNLRSTTLNVCSALLNGGSALLNGGSALLNEDYLCGLKNK